MKNILTTGTIARLCEVAPRTAAKWFDQGHLKGYRIPGGRERRVPIESFKAFCQRYGLTYALRKIEAEEAAEAAP